ncbi:MAG: 30S ribosomal protein S6 [Phycisphaerales bacterium]
MSTATAGKKMNRVYQYEAMFLIGQSQTGDLAAIIQHIDEIMQRGHATVISMKKWDERRLAYEIKGQKRGLYVLVYFRAPGDQLSHIERDCNLSEKILRAIVLRADHLTDDEMKAQDGRAELMAEAKLRAERPQVAPAPVAAAPAETPAE